MSLLTISNADYAYGHGAVLTGVSMTLSQGQRVGLVGRNGCGKTTLLRLIAGDLRPDDGQIQRSRGTRVGYLTQDPKLDSKRTLRREAEQAFADLADLHDRLEAIREKMGLADESALTGLMKDYERIEHAMESAGGYAVDHKIDAVLHGLGLMDAFFDVKVEDLSGGQKTRLALAKLLLAQPDVLLLDEPTNHLDIAGRQWLEGFLKEYPGAVLIVSHDRWLLDEVADKIVELEAGRLFEYPGNFQAYCEQRQERLLHQQRVYEKQQAHVRHQEFFIARYRSAQRAKQARGRETQLKRFKQDMVDPIRDTAIMRLSLPPAPRSGDLVIVANDLAKAYGEKRLFEDVGITIKRGERIGIVGPNGGGKSTLARVLLTEMPADRGAVRLGSGVNIGVYRQSHDHLDPADTPVSFLQRHLVNSPDQTARDVAGAFLFSGLEQDKPLGTLSGGERSRAALAALVIGGHNLLVLDEPSNHLDIPSAERLEEALRQYDGTLILITHDRRLLENTVDQLLILDGQGRCRHFLGTFSNWQASLQKKTDIPPPPKKKPPKKKVPPKPKPQSGKPSKKFSHLTSQQIEKRIDEVELELAELNRKLADPAVYRGQDDVSALRRQWKTLTDEYTQLEEAWLRSAERGND